MTEETNTGRKPNSAAVDEAIDYNARLIQAIQKTDQEFGRLPVFIRPIARNYFKDGAGQGIDEWNSALTELGGKLQAVKNDDNNAYVWLRASYPRLKEQLDKLQEFFTKAPGLVKNFTSDGDTIRSAEATAVEFSGVASGLIHALDQV